MGRRAVAEPGIRSRRYELITRSEQQRTLWYLVRRHLGFTRSEWEALPWHDQLVYMEGILEEFYEDDGDNYVDDTRDLSDVESRGAKVIHLNTS